MARSIVPPKGDRFELPNTTTWVDEPYSERLARQSVPYLAGADEDLMTTLKTVRTSRLYLNERPCLYGFGVKKHGTRVFALDLDGDIDGGPDLEGDVLVGIIEYDVHGKMRPTWRSIPPAFVIPQNHALPRLFLRQRTNSFADVRAALADLVLTPPPDGHDKLGKGVRDGNRWVGTMPAGRQEKSVAVAGVGIYHLAAVPVATQAGDLGLAWRIKTLVDEPPGPRKVLTAREMPQSLRRTQRK